MEKRKCILCLQIFPNGRAMEDHMKSHMLNLPILPKPEDEENPADEDIHQLTTNVETQSDSTFEEREEGEREEKKSAFYVLRENQKRSYRSVDLEFFDIGSVVLQDRDSETELFKNPIGRRSKRVKKEEIESVVKEKILMKGEVTTMIESWTEPEMMNSISNSTTDEDIAICLMLLSRDKWKRNEQSRSSEFKLDWNKEEEEEEEEEGSQGESNNTDEFKSCNYKSKPRTLGKYRCGTYHKVFKSYQALGGHRASHKKEKLHSRNIHNKHWHIRLGLPPNNAVVPLSQQAKKIHECPYCFRVFSSGQALGGHKRSHVTRVLATSTPTLTKSSLKIGNSLSMIDLNLPAPTADDNIGQIELSAVSNSEFVNQIKR